MAMSLEAIAMRAEEVEAEMRRQRAALGIEARKSETTVPAKKVQNRPNVRKEQHADRKQLKAEIPTNFGSRIALVEVTPVQTVGDAKEGKGVFATVLRAGLLHGACNVSEVTVGFVNPVMVTPDSIAIEKRGKKGKTVWETLDPKVFFGGGKNTRRVLQAVNATIL